MATGKPAKQPPAPPERRAWSVAQEVCDKLVELTKDDQRRVLAACATLLGLYEEESDA